MTKKTKYNKIEDGPKERSMVAGRRVLERKNETSPAPPSALPAALRAAWASRDLFFSSSCGAHRVNNSEKTNNAIIHEHDFYGYSNMFPSVTDKENNMSLMPFQINLN